jgi:hypothetical protein
MDISFMTKSTVATKTRDIYPKGKKRDSMYSKKILEYKWSTVEYKRSTAEYEWSTMEYVWSTVEYEWSTHSWSLAFSPLYLPLATR